MPQAALGLLADQRVRPPRRRIAWALAAPGRRSAAPAPRGRDRGRRGHALLSRRPREVALDAVGRRLDAAAPVCCLRGAVAGPPRRRSLRRRPGPGARGRGHALPRLERRRRVRARAGALLALQQPGRPDDPAAARGRRDPLRSLPSLRFPTTWTCDAGSGRRAASRRAPGLGHRRRSRAEGWGSGPATSAPGPAVALTAAIALAGRRWRRRLPPGPSTGLPCGTPRASSSGRTSSRRWYGS